MYIYTYIYLSIYLSTSISLYIYILYISILIFLILRLGSMEAAASPQRLPANRTPTSRPDPSPTAWVQLSHRPPPRASPSLRLPTLPAQVSRNDPRRRVLGVWSDFVTRPSALAHEQFHVIGNSNRGSHCLAVVGRIDLPFGITLPFCLECSGPALVTDPF